MLSYVSILLLCAGLVTMATAKSVEVPQTACSKQDLSSWGYRDYDEKVKVMESGKVISMDLQGEHYTGVELCKENETFGFDETNLWVKGGCRGTFVVCYDESHTFDAKINAMNNDLDTVQVKQDKEVKLLGDQNKALEAKDATLEKQIENLEKADIDTDKTVETLTDKDTLFEAKDKVLTDQVIMLEDKNQELVSEDEALAKQDKEFEARFEALETEKDASEAEKDASEAEKDASEAEKDASEAEDATMVEDSLDITTKPIDDIESKDWITFQHRTSGSVDFNRNWDNYTQGFGNDENFWLGLEKIHELCNKDSPCELRVDMARDDLTKFAKYDTFYINGSTDNFRIHVAGYSGTAGDSMATMQLDYSQMNEACMHDDTIPCFDEDGPMIPDEWTNLNGMMFTTVDEDNDSDDYGNCAIYNKSPWWFNQCACASLNGVYGSTDWGQGLIWQSFTDDNNDSLTFTEMKIRQI